MFEPGSSASSAHLAIHSSSQYFTSSGKMFCETVLKYLVKSRLKIFTAFPWSAKPVISSYKAFRLVRHVFPFVSPCWLLLITIFVLHVCKWFPEGFDPSPSQGLRWGWLAYGITDLLALLEGRSGMISSCQDLLLLVMAFQRQLRLTFWWHWPGVSALVCLFYQVSCSCLYLLIWSLSTVDMSFLLQIVFLVSWPGIA